MAFTVFHNICLTWPKQTKYLSLPNELKYEVGKSRKEYLGHKRKKWE